MVGDKEGWQGEAVETGDVKGSGGNCIGGRAVCL